MLEQPRQSLTVTVISNGANIYDFYIATVNVIMSLSYTLYVSEIALQRL